MEEKDYFALYSLLCFSVGATDYCNTAVNCDYKITGTVLNRMQNQYYLLFTEYFHIFPCVQHIYRDILLEIWHLSLCHVLIWGRSQPPHRSTEIWCFYLPPFFLSSVNWKLHVRHDLFAMSVSCVLYPVAPCYCFKKCVDVLIKNVHKNRYMETHL